MPIAAEQFEIYRDLILSGQIDQQDVPKLLADNAAFSIWYCQQRHDHAAPQPDPPPPSTTL